MNAHVRKPAAWLAYPLTLAAAIVAGYFTGYGLAYGIEALSIALDVNNTAFPLLGLLFVFFGLVGIWGVKNLLQTGKTVGRVVDYFVVTVGITASLTMFGIYGEPFVESTVVQFIDDVFADFERALQNGTLTTAGR